MKTNFIKFVLTCVVVVANSEYLRGVYYCARNATFSRENRHFASIVSDADTELSRELNAGTGKVS